MKRAIIISAILGLMFCASFDLQGKNGKNVQSKFDKFLKDNSTDKKKLQVLATILFWMIADIKGDNKAQGEIDSLEKQATYIIGIPEEIQDELSSIPSSIDRSFLQIGKLIEKYKIVYNTLKSLKNSKDYLKIYNTKIELPTSDDLKNDLEKAKERSKRSKIKTGK
jgi:hypothetical protein